MKKKQILEAWRNEEYYLSLSAEERAQVPEHPAGLLDIEDDVLKTIAGGCAISVKLYPSCPTSGYCTPCNPWECSA